MPEEPLIANQPLSPEVLRAEQSDASGAHGDAIDHLVAVHVRPPGSRARLIVSAAALAVFDSA